MSRTNLIVSVVDQTGSAQRLSPDSTRYRIVEACVDLSLDVLESPQGRDSLVDVATAIINARNQKKPPTAHIYRDHISRMPRWVNLFLARIRGNFPEILISPDALGEAEARRYTWGDSMEEYNARNAGILFLSKALIDNMVFSRTQPGTAYEMFKFQMAISVAHELVHFLTGFLTGNHSPSTPNLVALPGYARPLIGEAGRYWEGRFLGGVLEYWSSPNDPMGNRQTGTPYVFEHGLSRATGRQVSFNYIAEFNARQFSFPIRVSGQSTSVTRDNLKAQGSQETSHLRVPRVTRRLPAANSPPPDDPSWSTAFRQLPPSMYYEAGESSRSSHRRR